MLRCCPIFRSAVFPNTHRKGVRSPSLLFSVLFFIQLLVTSGMGQPGLRFVSIRPLVAAFGAKGRQNEEEDEHLSIAP